MEVILLATKDILFRDLKVGDTFKCTTSDDVYMKIKAPNKSGSVYEYFAVKLNNGQTLLSIDILKVIPIKMQAVQL